MKLLLLQRFILIESSIQGMMIFASASNEAICGSTFFRHAIPELGDDTPNYFDILNFTNYPEIIRDDSTITLAQAGTFTGPKDFKEYVAFATFLSPYVAIGPIINAYDIHFLNYNNETNTCHYRSLLQAEYLLDERMAINPDDDTTEEQQPFNVTYMINYQMYLGGGGGGQTEQAEDPPYLQKAFVYYPPEYLRFFFERVTNEKVGAYVCNELANSCNNTLDGEPHQTCIDNYLSLPMTHSTTSEDDYMMTTNAVEKAQEVSSSSKESLQNLEQHFDGNSRGCRTVHAVLAASTPTLHCPHIALTPMEDPNGQIKCQHSKGYDPFDFFDYEDLETLELFQIALGVDPNLGYKVTSTQHGDGGDDSDSVAAAPLVQVDLEEEEDADAYDKEDEEATSCDTFEIVCTVVNFFQSSTNSTQGGEADDLEP